MITRKDHLEWCKNRALEYVNSENIGEALASFMSDMNKHTKTRDHLALKLGMQLIISGHLNTQQKMREWIVGFN